MSLSLKQTDSQRTNLWLPREQGSGEGRIGSLGLVDANYVYAKSLSLVQPCETLWTVAHQAPLSTGFSRQEY